MEKFTASRLSDGNKIFPPEIHLDNQSLTVRMPGLFNGKSQVFGYRDISSVSAHTPLVGYSTITFYAAGTKVDAHGFTKAEVKKIQALIEERKSTSSESSSIHSQSAPSNQHPRRLGLSELIHGEKPQKSEEEKIRQEERDERHRKELADGVKNGAKTVFKGIGNMVNSKKIKEASDLHNELMGITDDIDIALNRGQMDIVVEMVKRLNHPSSLNISDESDTYMNYWTKKRKEYINKIS